MVKSKAKATGWLLQGCRFEVNAFLVAFRTFWCRSPEDPTREKFPRGPYLLSSYSFLSSLRSGGLSLPDPRLTGCASSRPIGPVMQPLITGEKSPLLSEEQSLFSFVPSFLSRPPRAKERPCVKSATKLEHIIQVENPPFGLSLPRIWSEEKVGSRQKKGGEKTSLLFWSKMDRRIEVSEMLPWVKRESGEGRARRMPLFHFKKPANPNSGSARGISNLLWWGSHHDWNDSTFPPGFFLVYHTP